MEEKELLKQLEKSIRIELAEEGCDCEPRIEFIRPKAQLPNNAFMVTEHAASELENLGVQIGITSAKVHHREGCALVREELGYFKAKLN